MHTTEKPLIDRITVMIDLKIKKKNTEAAVSFE